MVSLETETDRTLFFDLLPIDVGSIAGFNTRIQLYTVPGQVFYNTTRKLVLKGVDGVVFVADSQKAMLQANRESFDNLEENLAEMGLSIDEIPLVLQYNKRDLTDICSVEEMEEALNHRSWPSFEASALHGHGVFETLKGISKATLYSLRQRLSGDEAPRPAEAAQTKAAPSPPPTKKAAPPKAPPAKKTPSAKSIRTSRRNVMDELEKLRRQTGTAGARTKASKKASVGVANGRSEIHRRLRVGLGRDDFERVRRCKISLTLEDEQEQVVDTFEELSVEVDDPASFRQLLLRLQIALHTEGS